MAEFVRREIWPLEAIWPQLGLDGLSRAIAPLQEHVKARGLWATHLPPEFGGQGMGQVKLGLMHEILGTSPIAPLAFGNAAPDSGNSEILAMAGTPEQKDITGTSASARRRCSAARVRVSCWPSIASARGASITACVGWAWRAGRST